MDLPGVNHVLTTEELRRAGVSKTVIRERVKARRWQRLFNGVIYVASGPVPKEAWWMAGVKAGGGGAALHDVSAVSLLGLVTPVVSPIHVAIPYPRNRTSRRGLRFHRLTDLRTTTYNGIPVVPLHRVLAGLPQQLRDRDEHGARQAPERGGRGPRGRLPLAARASGRRGRRPHHRHEPQRSIDAARDARLQLAGYVVLRIDAGTPDLGLVEGALRALR